MQRPSPPPPTPQRLKRQLDFVLEIDKLKAVLRRSLVADGSRRENSAEHSWHLAMLVECLAEYASEPFDRAHAFSIALAHDLVEIDAGDTFAYGESTKAEQHAREEQAAERLFGMLPDDQAERLRQLWQEYEDGQSAEAKFVRVLDRLQPLLLHQATDGVVWQRHGVRKSQVLERMAEIEDNAPALWPTVCAIIDHGVAQGALLDE